MGSEMCIRDRHITIATTGNAQDFGDMLTVGAYGNATSDSHGGLS